MKPIRTLARLWTAYGQPAAPAAPPACRPNTFIVWEPCTYSHAEVVPGFVKYLLDLGYEVCVCSAPQRFDEGLFDRFTDPRIQLCRMPRRMLLRHFRRHGLGAAAGILITTARKISGANDYAMERRLFAATSPHAPVLLVEHDVRRPADHGALTREIITLRQVHYRDAATTVVNPHHFGSVAVRAKHPAITRFITIGALRSARRNTDLLVESVERLRAAGHTGFEVTVIGRGSLRRVPAAIRDHLRVLGPVDFRGLYREMDAADFMLPLLDPHNPRHARYLTTGTSGSFQLMFGFLRPCLIERTFAPDHGLDTGNAVVYDGNPGLVAAMAAAIRMSPGHYAALRAALAQSADRLYAASLDNLRRLVSTAERHAMADSRLGTLASSAAR